jgi:hypothetical protein
MISLSVASCWQDLFGASFEVLLYDLTSTYFESPLPDNADDKRRYGYSRDKRSDCTQVVIALIVTPDGFPLAYEVPPGNTADCATLRAALPRTEAQYGKAQRIWVMDRGIPTKGSPRCAKPIRPSCTLSARPRAGCRNCRRRCSAGLGGPCARVRFAAIQMLAVHFPTTDGPNAEQKLL